MASLLARAECARGTLRVCLAALLPCAGCLARDAPIVVESAPSKVSTTRVAELGPRGFDPATDCQWPLVFEDSALAAGVDRAIQDATPPNTVVEPASAAALERLGAEGARSLRGIECLTGLRLAALMRSELSDLTPLASLGALQKLYLGSNALEDLSPLAQLTQLRVLDLSDNRVRNLSALASLTRLQRLDLCDNEVEDLAPLSGLSQLVFLKACNNHIEDLGPLVGLQRLSVVALDGNHVRDIAPLATLPQLVNVSLSHNRIEDLGPLSNARRLQRLFLVGNRIADLAPLLLLPELKSVVVHPLAGGREAIDNPIDCAAQAETLQALWERDVNMTVDCPVGG